MRDAQRYELVRGLLAHKEDMRASGCTQDRFQDLEALVEVIARINHEGTRQAAWDLVLESDYNITWVELLSASAYYKKSRKDVALAYHQVLARIFDGRMDVPGLAYHVREVMTRPNFSDVRTALAYLSNQREDVQVTLWNELRAVTVKMWGEHHARKWESELPRHADLFEKAATQRRAK